jgi:hypothetical protein
MILIKTVDARGCQGNGRVPVLSDDSDYMTGQLIMIDGGMVMQ